MKEDIILNALITTLKDDNPSVRLNSAKSLAKIATPEAIKALKICLNDANEQVRNFAKKSLQKKGIVKNESKVPEWNTYYPSWEAANPEQKAFYEKWFSELNKGNFLDIEGNLSYVFVLLYSAIEQYIKSKDLDLILYNFELVEDGYGEYEKISNYLVTWRSDAYLYAGDRKNAFNVIKEHGFNLQDGINFSDIITAGKGNFIDGKDFIMMFGKTGLTKYGKENIDDVTNLVTIFIKDFYKENKKNFLQYFMNNFNIQNLSQEDFMKLKRYYPNEKKFLDLKRRYQIEKESSGIKKYWDSGYFTGVPLNLPYDHFRKQFPYLPDIVKEGMKNEGKRIIREAENTLREEKNLPKIGEGWISETELYYKILDTFPGETIVHHGRPSWLGRQHLDIYFPKRNLAIEYQGEQHQNPTEYFGGEKAFKLQCQRDNRKVKKCQNNGCKLIYVYPDYDFHELENQIKNSIGHNIKN